MPAGAAPTLLSACQVGAASLERWIQSCWSTGVAPACDPAARKTLPSALTLTADQVLPASCAELQLLPPSREVRIVPSVAPTTRFMPFADIAAELHWPQAMSIGVHE